MTLILPRRSSCLVNFFRGKEARPCSVNWEIASAKKSLLIKDNLIQSYFSTIGHILLEKRACPPNLGSENLGGFCDDDSDRKLTPKYRL